MMLWALISVTSVRERWRQMPRPIALTPAVVNWFDLRAASGARHCGSRLVLPSHHQCTVYIYSYFAV
jgi:hypothetical protein